MEMGMEMAHLRIMMKMCMEKRVDCYGKILMDRRNSDPDLEADSYLQQEQY